MKRFYLDGSGLFQDDIAPSYTARRLTEWFNKDGGYTVAFDVTRSPEESLLEELGSSHQFTSLQEICRIDARMCWSF